MKCFHHNDPDGKAAGWVVGKYERERGRIVEFIEMDYGIPFPFDTIQPYEKVVIVDYSIKPEEMERLLRITEDVVWIDHHKTAIEAYVGFGYKIAGFRVVGVSGCELAWDWFFARPAPESLKLIGDYDAWNLFFEPQCFEFYFGAGLYDLSPNGDFWDRCYTFEGDQSDFIHKVIEEGKIVMRYRKQFYTEVLSDIGYETEFHSHRCLCMNTPRVGSTAFGDAMKKYDICIAYAHNGDMFKVSLCSEKIDVSQIANIYGGGGHKGAAGFELEVLPFTKKK
jgi:oligoribonuclease NrnB/cAMP/cGMP phosphodiesterase (DHH superfamily)